MKGFRYVATAALLAAASLAQLQPGAHAQPVSLAETAKPVTLVERGMAQYADGEFAAAIGSMEEALRFNPRDARALYYLANAHWRLDQYERATDAFNRLLKADPRGPFAEEAREWLSAQGSFDVLAARVRVAPAPRAASAATARPARAEMQDGRTHMLGPAGWAPPGNEVVKSPDRGDIYRLVFRRNLGAGQAALLVVEAHHGGIEPAPGASRKGVPGMADIVTRVLAEQGIDEYVMSGTKATENGQEQDFTVDARPVPLQGTARGMLQDGYRLVAIAWAPKGSWPAILKQVQPAIGSLQTSPGGPVRSPSAAPSPSPSPSPSPTPPVWRFMPGPADATLSPEWRRVPWASPSP